MNEIQNIDTLTTEIIMLKQQVTQNIIEIGKRLISAKESLQHGEWAKYLQEKVDFSQRTANNFMKAASEFSNSHTFANLSQSKVFALLSLPAEEREEFVQVNDIEAMSTRELQQAIKDKKELEDKLKIANENLKAEEEARKTISNSYKIMTENNKNNYEQSQKLKKELEVIKKEKEGLEDQVQDNIKIKEAQLKKIESYKKKLEESQTSGNDEETKRLQDSLKEMQSDLDSSAQKIDELEAELKNKAIDVITAEPVFFERIPEEVEKELKELRKKDNPLVVKFKGNHSMINQLFTSQLQVMAEAKETDPENYENFKRNTLNMINKISEQL